MSPATSEIHLRWANLRNEPATNGTISVAASDLGVNTGYGPAMLSVSAGGKAQLLLPVAAGTRRPAFRDLAAIEVGATQLSDSTRSRPYLIVSCVHADLDRPFADLVLAVLSRIQDGESAPAALTAAVEELRALFGAPTVQAVEIGRIQGLVAELLVLRRFVARSPRAVELWSGPTEHRHDFRGGAHAIEVKSTRRQSGVVTITSVDQLDIPHGGTLELWRVVLDRTANGQVTVGSLVSGIEAITGRSSLLRDGLKAIGCVDPEADAWNEASFNVELMDAYRVIDGFPRIVAGSFGPAGVPPGVSQVTYSIDLNQAASFSMSAEEMAASEDRITECLA